MAMIIHTVEGVVSNKFEIGPTTLRFGRTTDNQVQIDDLAVSNEHAQVFSESNDRGEVSYILEDLGSTNGSFVNDVKIKRKQLHHNDVIRIGFNIFKFIDENEVDLEKTSKIKKSWIPGIYYSK